MRKDWQKELESHAVSKETKWIDFSVAWGVAKELDDQLYNSRRINAELNERYEELLSQMVYKAERKDT